MDSNFTDSVNSDKPNGQPDHSECMKLLQLVLDNEATDEQKTTFENHVCNCMPYFEIYEVDKAIKSLVKESCCGKNMPKDLAESIKAKIFKKTD